MIENRNNERDEGIQAIGEASATAKNAKNICRQNTKQSIGTSEGIAAKEGEASGIKAIQQEAAEAGKMAEAAQAGIKAAEAGTAAAAGVPTAGLGTVAVAAADMLKSLEDEGENGGGIAAAAVIGGILLLIVLGGYFISTTPTAFLWNKKWVESIGEGEEKRLAYFFGKYAVYEKIETYSSLGACCAEIINAAKSSLNMAFLKAAPEEVREKLNANPQWDRKLTWETWERNKNPYKNEKEEWNVNFSEFITVLDFATSQTKEGIQGIGRGEGERPFQVEAYLQFLSDESSLRFLYELSYCEKRQFREIWEETDEFGNTFTRSMDHIVDGYVEKIETERGEYFLDNKNSVLFAEVTLFPYDLYGLCEMVRPQKMGNNYALQDNVKVSGMRNIDMFSYYQRNYAVFLQTEPNLENPQNGIDVLGLYAKDESGRYIKEGRKYRLAELSVADRHIHNNAAEGDYEYSGNRTSVSGMQEAIASYVKLLVGCAYNQNRRWEDGVYDCSSLAFRAYQKVLGIYIGPSYAAGEAKYLSNKGCNVAIDDLQPGDLIFYERKKTADRYKGIGHVSVYIGNGECISASSPETGVIRSPLKTNSVVQCSRPVLLKKE